MFPAFYQSVTLSRGGEPAWSADLDSQNSNSASRFRLGGAPCPHAVTTEINPTVTKRRIVLATHPHPSFAIAATMKCEEESRDGKRRGGACLYLPATPRSPSKRKRKRNADRREVQPAVLLVRPRIQRDAHIYRRSTAALPLGLCIAKVQLQAMLPGTLRSADPVVIPRQGQNRSSLCGRYPPQPVPLSSSEHLASQSVVLGG